MRRVPCSIIWLALAGPGATVGVVCASSVCDAPADRISRGNRANRKRRFTAVVPSRTWDETHIIAADALPVAERALQQSVAACVRQGGSLCVPVFDALLRGPHAAVFAVLLQESGVGSGFDDAALIEHCDLVGAGNR